MITKIFIVIFLLFFLPGCTDTSGHNTVAKNLTVDDSGLDFQIYRDNGDYWGEFILYETDHTVSYSDNSGAKFREDVRDLEFIRYDGDDKKGFLFIKWPNDKEPMLLTNIEHTYWIEIKRFTEGWQESDKFLQ